ncbi:SIRT2 [Lepeophtheirus salmonis]|uniref:SIRT2 n=1 Tax=Lepeophtheirus salmonis TaxID=72036 RepID=A0A7R8HAW5_LEPSM|nr:SIRT2 [Lepeophtheirus salmonis]CAF2977034.1 SIRT2 [Lepeophtheirus salmonis]
MGQGSSSSIQGFSVESLVSQIQNGRYKNIVILCGAGISTNAGIPDFRSPSFGLYFKLRKFDLPYPEAVFEGKYFNKDPNPFYGLIPCGGVVRPDVVLFGETMPSRFCNLAHNDLKNADLLLVFGTSLAVAPYNGLITLTKSQIPRVYVSKTKPGQSTSTLGSFLGLNSSIKFDKPNDLVLIEDCDQVVRNLCSKLNWTQELNKL